MKSLTAAFLRRPVASLMLLSALCILGAISLLRLPLGLMPNLQNPGVTVITRYSGVAAGKIDEMITVPLERLLSDIPGIEKISSTSSDGESRINLIFNYDADIKVKILEASERIHLIRHKFPRDMEEPYIIQYDPSNRPVYIASFASKKIDLKKLREIVDRQVKLQFERIEGVSEVFVGGGFEREIQVQVDPSRLGAFSLDLGPISGVIAASNRQTPGGSLGRSTRRQIYAGEKLRSMKEIGALRFPLDDKGNTVSVERVAEVKDHYRDRTSIARTDGEDRVTVYIQKAGSANTLHITDNCEQITANIKIQDVKVHVSYNQGTYIKKAIARVSGACVYGGIIAIFVLFLFLRRGPMTLIIAFTTPCSILTTFFLMFLSGVEINVMSLSGLALGAGMLIDNSIVVSESIDSHLQNTNDQFRAVWLGTTQVFMEIVSATLTTIVVFIPLIFTSPETRTLYQGLTLTVIYSLLVSLAFSLTIMPSFIYFTLKRAPGASEQTPPPGIVARTITVLNEYLQQYSLKERLIIINKSLVSRGITGERINAKVYGAHRFLSRQMFAAPGYVLTALLILALLAPLLFWSLKKEAFSPVQSDTLEATVDLDTGTHLVKTQELIKKIEDEIRSHPKVREVGARIEKWHATLNIKLKKERFLDNEKIISELRGKTDKHPEAFVYYTRASEGKGGDELNVEFYGDNIPELKKFAQEMSGEIQKHVAGIDQVVLRFREGKNDILVRPDRIHAARLNATLGDVGQTLRYLLSGMIMTKFYDGSREVDVRLVGAPGLLQTPEDIYNLRLPMGDRSLPLRALAKFDLKESETRIWRKNKRKSVMITVKFGSRSADKVAGDIEKLFRNQEFPEEAVYAFGDEYIQMQKNQRQMLLAVLVSLLIIYLLLGALFESFKRPFLILITAPYSVISVLLVFSALRMTLNMSVYIGFIMLGGIVVNNSILVVGAIHRKLTEADGDKAKLVENIIQATATRIRPIMMTTLTTVLGMAPMVIDFSEGSELFRPLAITVSLGMTLAVLVSCLVVPFLSYYFYRNQITKNAHSISEEIYT